MGESNKALFVGLDVHKDTIAVAYAAKDYRDVMMMAFEGSFSYVVGLPMEKLAGLLAGFGFIAPMQSTQRDAAGRKVLSRDIPETDGEG